jgi:hypothetical protein
MVYPEVARFRETLDLALTGLREIARQWEPRQSVINKVDG